MEPITLTFIAPAKACNQKCPNCIIDLLDEPVRNAVLTPKDYVKFATDLYDAYIPIQAISFQGYEVTLPQSWPYVQAVFEHFGDLGAYQGFITNGMLLHKHAKKIRELKIARIAVSIDGGDADTNDYLRGLPGALNATVSSVQKFLAIAPEYADRLTIASVIYSDHNACSLPKMPKLIRQMGLKSWMLSNQLVTSAAGYTQPKEIRWDILENCRVAAEEERIEIHISDEFGFIDKNYMRTVPVKQLFDKNALLRLLPSGHVVRGQQFVDPKESAKQVVSQHQRRRFYLWPPHFN